MDSSGVAIGFGLEDGLAAAFDFINPIGQATEERAHLLADSGCGSEASVGGHFRADPAPDQLIAGLTVRQLLRLVIGASLAYGVWDQAGWLAQDVRLAVAVVLSQAPSAARDLERHLGEPTPEAGKTTLRLAEPM